MIKELKALGLSQAMIARELRVTRQAVTQWFSGERTPSARSIKRLSLAMSELTGKAVTPADVYNLITAITERKEREREAQ